MKIWTYVIFFLLIFSCVDLHAQEFESVEKLISDSSQQVKTIPLTSISSGVENSNQLIRKVTESLNPPEGIQELDSVLSVYKIRIDSINTLMEEETLKFSAIQDIERKNVDLSQYKKILTEYNSQLQTEIDTLDNEIQRIQKLDQVWENTRSLNEYKKVSAAIRTEINSLVMNIKDIQKELQNLINKYLEMQIEINSQLSQIQGLLDKIDLQKEEFERNLFARAAPPLWDFLRKRDKVEVVKIDWTNLLELRKEDIHSYFTANRTQVYLAVLYIILFQLFFLFVKDQIKKTQFEKELDVNQNTALTLLKNNWATALVLGFTFVYLILPNKTIIIINILILVSLFPFYYLLTREVEKKYYFLISVFFSIFLLTLFIEPIREVSIFRRYFLLILNLVTVILLVVLLQKKWYRIFKYNLTIFSARLFTQLFVILLIISMIANVWGSYRFSIYLTYAITASLFYAMLVYLLYLVFLGITTAFLFSRSASRLHVVKSYRFDIEHKISVSLRSIMGVVYLLLMFRAFRILNDITQFFKGILDHPYHIGNFNFTIGNILLFIVILTISQWISKFIVFILNEQVYYQTRKKKDIAASVSALVQFTVITIGFILGVVAIGFELDKLTILLSAFGVGIGFGLQNIFNNLVSGIIMVFERPLQVGDVIEVGQLIGTVKTIGIRSSVVRTFDGSEVIVPNGNLISNELINWTHSDMQRRLIIKVGVAYGTDPEKVISILEKEAGKSPDILENPKPYVLFTEFADSSLNFELRCWTDNFDNWIFILSDLRVRINQALKAGGITIPFPQRDVHVFNTESVKAYKPAPKKK